MSTSPLMSLSLSYSGPRLTTSADLSTSMSLSSETVTVVNYGSGTSLATMIKPRVGHSVLNVDTGHMALARMIEICLKNGDVSSLGGLLDELVQAYGESKNIAATVDDLFDSKDLGWLKHNFFSKKDYQGAVGVRRAVGKMAVTAQAYFWEKENRLDQKTGFKIGDVDAIEHYCADADVIYCINGYGYEPLTDEKIFIPMWAALNPGGKLIIVSSPMGPTVKAFLGWTRRQCQLLSKVKGSCPFEEVITILNKEPTEVGALEYFEFVSSESAVFDSVSAALAKDVFTVGLESRHTEGGTQIAEITVKLVFFRH